MYPYTDDEFERYLQGENEDEKQESKSYDYDSFDDAIEEAVNSRFEDDNAREY